MHRRNANAKMAVYTHENVVFRANGLVKCRA